MTNQPSNQSTTATSGGRRGSWASIAASAVAPAGSATDQTPLIPTAILDPTSRQAKWAAYETQRRASLQATDTLSLINQANMNFRSNSKSPTNDRSPSPRGGGARRRPSVSNVHDEVVHRSVSPPGADEHPASPNSTYFDAPAHRARRGSTPSLSDTRFTSPPANSIDLHNISRLSANNLGSNPMSSHAANLLNMAGKNVKEMKTFKNVRLNDQELGEIRDDVEVDEEYDQFDVPASKDQGSGRSRSKSISSYDPIQGRMREIQVGGEESGDLAAIWGRVQASHRPAGQSAEGFSSNATSNQSSPMNNVIPHRRSSTLTYSSSPWNQSMTSGGDATPPQNGYPNSIPQHMHSAQAPFNSLPSTPDRVERLRSATQRRFSVSPTVSSGEYDHIASRRAVPMEPMNNVRRHSVAEAYQPPGRRLSDALATLSMESHDGAGPGGYNNLMLDLDEYYGHTPESLNSGNVQGGSNGVGGTNSRRASFSQATGAMGSGPTNAPSSTYSEVGRGIPLHILPSNTILYIVEFKAGRSDIYYFADEKGTNEAINKGDLVIVEADRGKDLGKVINNSITPHQIHLLQAQQSEAISDLHRVNREIHPKRIYCLAQQQEVQMLLTKMQDESKALAVCQTKVRQKKLPMNVVDAEYQWDRRKLTFYFIAERRIDFRELVRDLFKIYKTRIWMCAVSAIHKAPYQDETTSPMLDAPSKLQQQQQHAAESQGSDSDSPTNSSTLGFTGHPGYQSYPGFAMQQGSPTMSPVQD